MTDQPTGTVTFLFTDIEGSTRLWESNPQAMGRMVARHDELLNAAIVDNAGYVFTTAGDAFAAAFADPSNAASAAVAAQRSLGTEPWESAAIRVRIGLHTGVAQERDGDYFGPVLNRAARIMSAGHGGQVLVSRSTGDLLARRLPDGATLTDLGDHRLKDLGSPERLHQLHHPDLETDFPALNTLDAHLNNLPVELSSFVGRVDELNETIKRLADSRLVTLTGVGGSGKTRLALQTAAECFDDFPDGVWIAEMAGLAEAERFPHWVAEEMGIARSAGATGLTGSADDRSWIEVVIDYLSPRTALLVLDNCEHLIGAAAEFSEAILRASANVKILTTSREGLGIRGEYLIQVPSLALPSLFDKSDAAGAYPDAMELFAERASAVNARFQLDETTAPSVADICRRLDGMPLAIELAAARTRMLSPEQIAERLDDTFRLLTGGSRTALPRQQTLLATVDWSYQLLTDTEKALFERLAVFRGGFSLDAAEAIIAGDGVDEFDVFDLLASLVDKSMIQGGAVAGRFRLLETLRQFALAKLTDAGAGEEWRRRHAEFFAQLADEAFDGTRGSDQVGWLERLELDHDNIRAALTWAIEAEEFELAGRIAGGVWWFWNIHGHRKSGLEYFAEITPHIDELDPTVAIRVLVGVAIIMGFDDSTDSGMPHAERVVELAEDMGSNELLGHARLGVALSHFHMDRHDNAFADFRLAHDAFTEANNEWGMGWATIFPARIYRMQADVEASERLIDIADGHFARSRSSFGRAWAVTTKGIMARYRFEFDESVRHHDEALGLLTDLGDRQGVSFSHSVASISLYQGKRYDEAIARWEAAHAIDVELGNVHVEGLTVGSDAYRLAGDMDGAVRCMLATRPILETSPETTKPIVAETLTDTAVALGIFDSTAELLGFADGARVRVARPIPAPFMEQRTATDQAVAANIEGYEEIRTEWMRKDWEDALPLIESLMTAIEAAWEQQAPSTT